MQLFRVLAVLTLVAWSQGSEVKLGIVYWGDVRSSLTYSKVQDGFYVECASAPNACAPNERRGSLGALQEKIKDVQNNFLNDVSGNSTIKLMTGNFVGGETGYLGCFGWQQSADLLTGDLFSPEIKGTYLKPDYMSLGIADFETGVDNLVAQYLNRTQSKITTLVSNADCSFGCRNLDTLTSTFDRYTVSNKLKIGIVGFVNPLANDIALTSTVNFEKPSEAIAKIVNSASDVDFFIAVGSGSYDIAEDILKKSEKVKLVIYGGGTKDLASTLLNEDLNGFEKYGNGRYIATTGSKYGHKIGALKLTIDEDSKTIKEILGKKENVTATAGNTTVDTAIRSFRSFTECQSQIGAETVFLLDGSSCWKSECNLGNLVADAMVRCAYNHNQTATEGTPILSVWHGGALHKNTHKAGEQIKEIDLHRWLPYHNKAYLVSMSGSTLWQLFEISGSGLEEDPNWGQFLQVSNGIQAYYDDEEISTLRVLYAAGSTDGVPRYTEVNSDNTEYRVVIPTMIYQRRGAWKNLGDFTYINDVGFDDDCLKQYLVSQGKVTHGFEDRIFLNERGSRCRSSNKTGLTIFLTLLVTGILVGIAFAFNRFVVAPRRANNNWLW